MSQYNDHITEPIELFKSFLLSCNKSRITIKNYLSDIRYFLGWLYGENKTVADPLKSLGSITKNKLLAYRLYLIECNIPKTTINRRLSALRFFIFALHEKGILSEDFSSGIKNVTSHSSSPLDYEANSNKQINMLISEYRFEMDEEANNKDQIASDITDFFSSIFSRKND